MRASLQPDMPFKQEALTSRASFTEQCLLAVLTAEHCVHDKYRCDCT